MSCVTLTRTASTSKFEHGCLRDPIIDTRAYENSEVSSRNITSYIQILKCIVVHVDSPRHKLNGHGWLVYICFHSHQITDSCLKRLQSIIETLVAELEFDVVHRLV